MSVVRPLAPSILAWEKKIVPTIYIRQNYFYRTLHSFLALGLFVVLYCCLFDCLHLFLFLALLMDSLFLSVFSFFFISGVLTVFASCSSFPSLCQYYNMSILCVILLSWNHFRCKPYFLGDGLVCEPAPRFEGNFLLVAQVQFLPATVCPGSIDPPEKNI